jgi:hypothetical protein
MCQVNIHGGKMNDKKNAGERTETNIYLVAAYLTNGGKLDRSGVDRSDVRHIKLKITGDEETLSKTEDDWFSGGSCRREFPADVLKEYAEHLKDVKALIHS